ncbi:MAG TPA: RcpC/CpaB family pilus assembly protein [Acidimicrobiales bacterium]|nr:RcpC/CpaB family pilus assembly protein [Acidimicrobiales bacterium]
MKRKMIGLLAALLLAGIGTAALVVYVESARDKAVADEALVDVYVVDKAIPKGTPVGKIPASVAQTEVPAKVLADDAVTDLGELGKDLATAVDLEPGEQLLRSRLVAPDRLGRAAVPAGRQELTVPLDPSRAVGGSLHVGDTVGVVLSFEPFDQPGSQDKTPSMSHLTFHKVVVTSVQFAEGDSRSTSAGSGDKQAGDDDTKAEPAPANQVLVTLALSSRQVEQVVFAAEFGHIWLTAEGAAADESGTRVITLGDVYKPAAAR